MRIFKDYCLFFLFFSFFAYREKNNKYNSHMTKFVYKNFNQHNPFNIYIDRYIYRIKK